MLELGELNVILSADDSLLQSALDGVRTSAAQAGEEAGEAFGDETVQAVASSMGELRTEVATGADRASDAMVSEAEQGAAETENAFGVMGENLQLAMAALGAVLGVSLSESFTNALDLEQAEAKFEAQIGNARYAEDLGKIAGTLYTNGFGESVASNMSTITSILASGLVVDGDTDDYINQMTQEAIVFAQTWDTDVTEAIRAAGQMVRTGLVDNGTEAFDLLTRGMEEVGDLSGDLLDTFYEYSTQFREAGISGAQALGEINQMVAAGAPSIDKAADAIKEFAIRSKDASESSQDAFESLGLNADQMFAIFAAGGDDANDAMTTVLERIKAMKDPLEQNTVVTELFGTQAEDLGDALYAIDPSTAVESLGEISGSIAEATDSYDTSAQHLENFKRSVQEAFTEAMGEAVGPLSKVTDWLTANKELVGTIGRIHGHARCGNRVGYQRDYTVGSRAGRVQRGGKR